VRREDQDKINKFSRLHQREINLEDELKAKHVCEVSWGSWVGGEEVLIRVCATEGEGGSGGYLERA
jgi:hypothetical protein